MKASWGVHAWEGRGFSERSGDPVVDPERSRRERSLPQAGEVEGNPAVKNAGSSPHRTACPPEPWRRRAVGWLVLSPALRDEGREGQKAAATFWSF